MVSDLPPANAAGHFDVVKVVKASWLGLIAYHGALLDIARYPFLLGLILSLLSIYYLGSFLGAILILFTIAPLILFTVSWQRFILMNEVAGSLQESLRWARAQWRTLRLLLALFFLSLLFIFVASSIFGRMGLPPVVNAVIVTLLIYYAMIRHLFMIPATAVGEKNYTAVESWNHTKGHATRIFCGLILVNAPNLILLLINNFLSEFLFNGHFLEQKTEESAALSIESLITILHQAFVDQPLLYMTTTLINQAIQFISIAVNLSFIDHVFQQVTGWVPAKPLQDGDDDQGRGCYEEG